jgi:hypothetical protein
MLKIFLLDAKTERILPSFLAVSLSNPFAIYGVSQDLFVKYVLSELSHTVSKGGFVLVAKKDDELVGLISLKQSDWDSNHFGIRISKIDQLIATGNYLESINIKRRLISGLLTECSKELLLHLSARVNKEDLSSIHALESKYFGLMDILVTYSIDFRKHPLIYTENLHHVRKFRLDEIPKLAQIALECFENTAFVTDRFHADPVLPKVKSSELYARWLENSCKDPSSEVLVAEIDGKPVGFNICSINNCLSDKIGLRVGTMALTAVEAPYRNKLVAVSLLNASLSWLADKVDVVDTGGQVSNYAIQRAWNAVGLKITWTHCTFHWSVLTESI